jgi:hypothetical protein
MTNVIHEAKPAERLVGRTIKSHLFKVLHEEAGTDSEQWPTHSVGLLVELATETEKGRRYDMAEESQVILIKMSAQEASPMGTLLKSETTSKLRRMS